MKTQLLCCLIVFFIAVSTTDAQRRRGSSCSGNVTASRVAQILQSPNYPRAHGNNLRCSWTITAGNERNVIFTFTELDTESCCDYIDIFDDNVKIGRYSGRHTTDIPVVSTSNRLTLRFRTDSSIVNTGFQGNYRETINCGGSYQTEENLSYIVSPYYPDPHPRNLDCFWTITAKKAREKVQVILTEGRIDPCCDFVQIFEGARSLAKIRGNITIPRAYSSVGRTLNVYFHSSSPNPYTGFKMSHREFECGGDFSIFGDQEGLVTSPNFPNRTHHNLRCNYTFIAQPGYRVEITISVNTETCCDYIQIYEGAISIGRLKGIMKNTNLISRGNSLRLYFRTDSSVGSIGFNATYRQVLSRCGPLPPATITTQQLSSPGYPLPYPSNYRCDWTINTGKDTTKQVLLTINDFTTETCCDYLQLFDGLKSIGKLQGDVATPLSFVTRTNSLRLQFYSDESTSKKGFTGTYKIANNCGIALSARSRPRTVTTPRYPEDYRDNLDCMWTITANDKTLIQFNITEGEIEDDHDYLQIIDGLKTIATLYGLLIPQTYISSGSTLRLYFHSDSVTTRDGFTATYKELCTYSYNVTSRTPKFLRSPNYPNHSPHNLDCYYNFQTLATNGRIKISITDVQTESCCDYLQVFDSDSSSLRKYQGTLTATPQEHTSDGTTLRLRYHTDSSVGSRGFQLTYQLV